MPLQSTTPPITEDLCEAFARAADALSMRQAGRIPERSIDDFVALGWLAWRAGALQVTPLGHMALARIRSRLVEAVA